MEQLTHIGRGLIGLTAFIGLAVLFNSNRRAIPWRLVFTGLGLQIFFGFLVLHVDAVRQVVEWVGMFFVNLLEFNAAGAEFLFGSLITDKQTFGYIFAFNVLPTIIFFSALTSLLFYLGVLQKIVYAFAWVMSKTMNLSGAESLSASANIFLGQTESPLLIKPYLAKMTRSELMAVMCGGFATIAGAVLVAYIDFSLQYVFGIIFAPLAWLMGVGYGNLTVAGQIIGEKTILNEFFAYGTLGKVTASGLLPEVRDQIILTYALCGFSNIASIGIQIGGIGTLAPNQRSTLTQIGVKALLGGSIACFLTACVASMLT